MDKTVQVHEGWQKPGDLKTTGLILYDKQAKLFRSWQFDNKGVFPRSESTGQWDAETETLSFHSDLGNRNKLTGKLVFVNDDRIDWTVVIHNEDGRLMLDYVGRLTRKK